MEKIIPTQVFQGETNECGLACIAMLAETQGIDVTLSALRERFPASQHGMSLVNLYDILNELAIPAYPISFEHGELASLPLPAILHYGANHYVLLAYRQGNYVCVMNPAIGQQLLPVEALKLEISGFALVLDTETQPDEDAVRRVAKSKRLSALACLSLKETASQPGIYRLMALAFLISLTLFIMPMMVGSAINDVYSSAKPQAFPWLMYLLAFAASTSLALIVRIVTERYIKRFALSRSVAGFSRLLSNSLNFFDKRAPGEIFSRFASWQIAATQKIELDNGLRTDWIVGAIALGVMCYMSPLLAMVSAIGVMLMGMVSVWAIYRDRFYTQQLQALGAAQNEFILESIQGFSTIRSAGLGSIRKTAFALHAQAFFTSFQNQKIYEQGKSSVYQLISSLEMVFFMLLALPLLQSGRLSMGEFFAYSFVREIFTGYITRIFFAILQKNQLHVIDTRARDLFPTNELGGKQAGMHYPKICFTRGMSYRHLVFAWEAARPVLHGITLDIKPGEKIAIVGESGAGKSTLLKVMAGLLPCQQGETVIDGQVASCEQLQRLLFLQSQEDILFNGSVLQNITLFDGQVDEGRLSRIDKSLEGLQLASVIAALPGGKSALIRESHAALSLGQRQRLLLARAMYSDRPILMLDEPTANLDEETARQVIETLLAHCREYGKTLIIVTHGENALPLFDKVYHMKEGHLKLANSGAASPELAEAF